MRSHADSNGRPGGLGLGSLEQMLGHSVGVRCFSGMTPKGEEAGLGRGGRELCHSPDIGSDPLQHVALGLQGQASVPLSH